MRQACTHLKVHQLEQRPPQLSQHVVVHVDLRQGRAVAEVIREGGKLIVVQLEHLQ